MIHTTAHQWITALMWTGLVLSSGCAAFRPISGVPARYLAPELRAISRAHEATIDLSLLAQNPPPQHLVGGGDVLGIYIEGVLGNPGEAPPITVPITPDLPPAIGYPITVRDDGTLSLPLIGSIPVTGMTIRQVEEELRRIYTVEKNILRGGQERIIVSLQRPRQVRVLVLRQESGGAGGGTEFAQGVSINLGQTKRGNGQAVDLPIYKNDVLHALARTGGLPGLDAENTIYILRRQQTTANCPTPAHPGSLQPAPPFVDGVSMNRPQPHGGSQGIQLMAYQQPAESAPHTAGPAAHPTAATPQQLTYGNPVATAEAQARFQREQFGGHTIHPVTARNFQSGNPLDELRAGMHDNAQASSIPADLPTYAAEPAQHPAPVAVQQASLRTRGTAAPPAQIVQSVPDGQVYEIMPAPQGAGGARTPFPSGGHTLGPPLMAPGASPTPLLGSPTLAGPQGMPGQQGMPVPQGMYHSQGMPGMNGPYIPAEPLPPIEHRTLGQYQGFGYPGEGPGPHWGSLPHELQQLSATDPTMNSAHVIKIPVRLKPGQRPHIRPEDVILHDGDIVFIESRETEIFYTGGLLGGGQYTLPRDYDLDVLGAIAVAQGASQQQSQRQIGGVSAFNGDVTISASDVIILRQLPNGSQVPIKVDLYRAIRDPAERVLIQPGDIVMLRYKRMEAVGAFIERNLLESALFGLAATQLQSVGGGGGN